MEKCGKLKQEVVLGLLAVVDNFMRGNMFRFGDRIMNGARFASPGLIWEEGRCMLSVECLNPASFLCLEFCPQMYKSMANDSSTDNLVESY